MNLKDLTPEEEAVVKWQYHLHGDFKTALFNTMVIADFKNLERLKRGFPDEVNGYLHYISTPGWWEGIKEKMRAQD